MCNAATSGSCLMDTEARVCYRGCDVLLRVLLEPLLRVVHEPATVRNAADCGAIPFLLDWVDTALLVDPRAA